MGGQGTRNERKLWPMGVDVVIRLLYTERKHGYVFARRCIV